MVVNLQRQSPTRVHNTAAEARTEAVRLAKLRPGDRFIVLESVYAFEIMEPIVCIEYN